MMGDFNMHAVEWDKGARTMECSARCLLDAATLADCICINVPMAMTWFSPVVGDRVLDLVFMSTHYFLNAMPYLTVDVEGRGTSDHAILDLTIQEVKPQPTLKQVLSPGSEGYEHFLARVGVLWRTYKGNNLEEVFEG